MQCVTGVSASTLSLVPAVPIPQSLVEYNVRLDGCQISLLDKAGGRAQTHPENGDRTGNFRMEIKSRHGGANLQFECIQQPAEKYCPDALTIKEDDPSTRKLMQEVHYSKIHPLYYGEAHASTLTAVPPPRTRVLSFCIGDDRRTLVGRSIVGNERSAITTQVLEIVKTIRFTDR